MSALEEIEAERSRQVRSEGWSTEHDDRHRGGELALAAACYAAPARIFIAETVSGRAYDPYTVYRDAWPWADEFWKPTERRRDLIKAAALILAEVERIDRATPVNISVTNKRRQARMRKYGHVAT